MKKLLIPIVIFCLFASCKCTSKSDFEKGKKQLEAQGYVNVEYSGRAWFCCDDKEEFSTSFKAKAPNGEDVKGCFCSSLGKGVTIRFK